MCRSSRCWYDAPVANGERMGQLSEQDSRNTTGEHTFDDLAKGLAGGTVSRRKALRWLGAALFGGAVASIPGVALAAPKPGKGPCRPEQFQCGKKCCPDVASCVKGQCVCPTGTELVNGQCVTVGACPPGTVLLSNGTCVKSCTTAPECPGCTCYGNVENPFEGYCGIDYQSLPPSSSCTTHADCPTGQFCGAFGEFVCIPTC